MAELVHVHREFKNLHYAPVSKSIIGQVYISIKTETGSNVPFVTGKTMIKLRFRIKKNSINTLQPNTFCDLVQKRYKHEFFGGTDKRILQDDDRISEFSTEA